MTLPLSPPSPTLNQIDTSTATTTKDFTPNDVKDEEPNSIDGKGLLSADEHGQVRYLGKATGFYLLQKRRICQNGAFYFSGYSHKLSSRTSHNIT